jgi:hypothetical protein
MTVARFGIPGGWSAQAFCFALDPSPEQAACLRRLSGGRRHARNWAVRTLKADLDRHQQTGERAAAPSLAGPRKRWNRVKDAGCTDAETGQVWWPHVSKEAFADGIKGAVAGTSATTTPRSTSHAASRPWRVIAPSAQSGPPSSAEPTVRPGPARPTAKKRGSNPAATLGNNPETDEYNRSPAGNG